MTRSSDTLALSRRALLRAAGATAAALVVTGAVSVATQAPALAAQPNWRWCKNCQSLWYAGNGISATCARFPLGQQHSDAGSGNYSLEFRPSGGDGQENWRWCIKCNGLWFSGNGDLGVCTVRPDQGHTSVNSANYVLQSDGGGQEHWRWCRLCDWLWFSGNGVSGFCPFFARSGGGGHSLVGSGNYTLDVN